MPSVVVRRRPSSSVVVRRYFRSPRVPVARRVETKAVDFALRYYY